MRFCRFLLVFLGFFLIKFKLFVAGGNTLLEKLTYVTHHLMEDSCFGYWTVQYNALLEKTNVQGSPLYERTLLYSTPALMT